MIINHMDLIEKAIDILKEQGFKDSEIKKEYQVKLKDGTFKIVDVVGINSKERIAIECGGLTKDISVLNPFFNRVIHLPYVMGHGREYSCIGCNHQWISRVDIPKQCPKCKRYFKITNATYDWNKKQNKGKKKC